jgi:hypothetical protein
MNSTGKFGIGKDKWMEYIHPYPYLMILNGGKIQRRQKENQFH